MARKRSWGKLILSCSALLGLFVGGCDVNANLFPRQPKPQFTTFFEWCTERSNLDPARRRTVEALLEIAETSDCKKAHQNLNSREGLGLSGAGITNLEPLSSLTHMTSLGLHQTHVSDLKPISRMTSLTELQITGAEKLKDISPLFSLVKLIRLDIVNSLVENIAPLGEMHEMQDLNLYGNQISDLASLSSMKKLARLTVNDNKVSNLTPLSSFTNLRVLNLSCNQLQDISPLAALTKLNRLSLSSNRINDVKPLANLKFLSRLSLNYNYIRDIEPLKAFPYLTIKDIEIKGNPVDGSSTTSGRDCGYFP